MRKTRFGALTPLVVLAIGLGGYLSGGVATAAAQEPAQPLEFHRDIRPILAESCLLCHGPNDAIRQADLRFDTDDFLDRVVVPGDAEASVLYERLTTEDPIRKMPPAGMSLSDEQIDLVRQWIDGGAEMGDRAGRRRRAGDARADRGLRPRGPADPFRELLHLPRAGRRGAPARPAPGRGGRALLRSRRVRRSGHHARQRRREPAHPPGERRRRPRADALPPGPEHPGHAGHRRGRPRPRRDRDPAAVDRSGGRVAVALGVHPARAAGSAAGGRRRVGPQPHRQLRQGGARAGGQGALSRGRHPHAAPPRHVRSDRAAADGRRYRRGPQRRLARRLRAARRPHARVGGIRRADGRRVARRGPLRRLQRVSDRRPAADVALPRLGDRRLQRQHAVRSVHHRADRRRHAPQRHARAENRHRLQPQPRPERRGRHRPRGVPGRERGRSRVDDGHGVDGADARVRALPRPQVRPDLAEGVLRDLRLLQQHPRARQHPRPRREGVQVLQLAAARHRADRRGLRPVGRVRREARPRRGRSSPASRPTRPRRGPSGRARCATPGPSTGSCATSSWSITRSTATSAAPTAASR